MSESVPEQRPGDGKDIDARVHRYILNNVSNEVADKEALKIENELLKKACETLTDVSKVMDLVKVMETGTESIENSPMGELGDTLTQVQEGIQECMPTMQLTSPADVIIQIKPNWEQGAANALKMLVKKIQSDEESIKSRQGEGFKGTVGSSSYKGKEKERYSGGLEALNDILEMIAFSGDHSMVDKRIREKQYQKTRLSRALISTRPLYKDHKSTSVEQAEKSISEIKAYKENLEHFFSEKLSMTLSDASDRKLPKIEENSEGGFTFIDCPQSGEDVYDYYDLQDCIDEAKGELECIVDKMESMLMRHKSSVMRYKAGDRSATGDINNLAMVRYDAILIKTLVDSGIFEGLIKKTYGNFEGSQTFDEQLIKEIVSHCNEEELKEWEVYFSDNAMHMMTLLFISCFRKSHDAIFAVGKLRFGNSGAAAERFYALKELDDKIGSSSADLMHSLHNATRRRQDKDFHVALTKLTFSRIERSVSIYTPLVTAFGLVMSSTDKLLTICNLVLQNNEPDDSHAYMLHQLLACHMTHYMAAKYTLKKNLFDGIKVMSAASGPSSSGA